MALLVMLMMKFERLVLVIIISVMDTGNSDIGIGVCVVMVAGRMLVCCNRSVVGTGFGDDGGGVGVY